jgi:hypothetical protein
METDTQDPGTPSDVTMRPMALGPLVARPPQVARTEPFAFQALMFTQRHSDKHRVVVGRNRLYMDWIVLNLEACSPDTRVFTLSACTPAETRRQVLADWKADATGVLVSSAEFLFLHGLRVDFPIAMCATFSVGIYLAVQLAYRTTVPTESVFQFYSRVARVDDLTAIADKEIPS